MTDNTLIRQHKKIGVNQDICKNQKLSFLSRVAKASLPAY